MNITFLISNLSNSGGTQRVLALLCNELVNYYSITILTNKDGASFFFLDPKIKIVVLNGNVVRRNIQIYNFLRKNRIQYYINMDSNSVLFNGFLLPSFTKLIIWEHFSLITNSRKFLFRLSRKFAVYKAYKFILLSQSEVFQWRRLYALSPHKSTQISNPVTVQAPQTLPGEKFHSKTFLAIGNNINVKGFDILLEAWKNIDSAWKLNIVGLPKADIDTLNLYLQKNDVKNVNIYPKSKAIEEFYKNSSAFILSSRKEATPLVLIESQCFGLPAIVFNHLPSVIELLDKSALIADYKDAAKSLKSAMEELIHNQTLYYKLSENAIKNAQRFDLKCCTQKWKAILK